MSRELEKNLLHIMISLLTLHLRRYSISIKGDKAIPELVSSVCMDGRIARNLTSDTDTPTGEKTALSRLSFVSGRRNILHPSWLLNMTNRYQGLNSQSFDSVSLTLSTSNHIYIYFFSSFSRSISPSLEGCQRREILMYFIVYFIQDTIHYKKYMRTGYVTLVYEAPRCSLREQSRMAISFCTKVKIYQHQEA